MKIVKWLNNNLLLVISLFLLAFIPLYPKLPLFDVQNTWINIRIEDFLITVTLFAWLIQLIRKKATLRTPLTIPIIIYWLVGLLSLVYGVVVIFPHLANVFPNVAILFMLRHIEYLSVFFVAFVALKKKTDIKYVIGTLAITMLLVSFYGFAQKGFIVGWEHRFPAFSTMNEEFSKGIPLLISAANRVQSTFAGHYDLAAYLILIIPIMGSFVIGVKKWWGKLFFFAVWIAGLLLLLMTASRVSFAVYLVGISCMFVLQKQKRYIIPVILGSIILLNFFQGISQRFAGTISQVDTVVDARTGKIVGTLTPETKGEAQKVVIKEETPTGESLPVSQSGIINIPSAPKEQKTVTTVQIEKKRLLNGIESTEVTNVEGNFVIKRALAYDLSFTTRFQGEWPRAMEAFNRNILLGSGYSSINAATDNNYLRILGETGLLGFFSFGFIFLIMGIYTYKILPDVDSPLARSFIYGGLAGLIGLGLNAVLIDVFEASKVAFVLWLLIGFMMGILHLYQKRKINYFTELQTVFTSIPAMIIYLTGAGAAIFSTTLNNYFVADDFSWMRWVADCRKIVDASGTVVCEPVFKTLLSYFLNADGFFYRPGMKIFFYYMYSFAWLNPSVYHIASLLLHIAVSCLVYLLSQKLLQSKSFGLITAILFLGLSSHSESVLWISSVGHLFAAFFTLLALLFHLYWRDTKQIRYFIVSICAIMLAPLFQEVGVVAALLVVLYDLLLIDKAQKATKNVLSYLVYLIPVPLYFLIRTYAKSHISGGDYTYNLAKLPFNLVGNIIGYILLAIGGSAVMPFYDQLRTVSKGYPLVIAIVIMALVVFSYFLVRWLGKKVNRHDRTVIIACMLFFVVPLLPVLPLGNIALRYVYLASFGIVLFLVFVSQKIYSAISGFNKYAAMTAIVILMVGFFSYQYQQLMRVNTDWQKAGKLTQSLLKDINYMYYGLKTTPPNPVLYFVNTPVKYGEAWIFPVGLPDALWFTFQTEHLTVHTPPNINIALDAAEGSNSARVFEFDKDWNVEQVSRVKETIIVK